MIDVDYYKSTVEVLSFIEPLLNDGTIIIFDDWFNYKGHPNRGEQKAFREWCQKPEVKQKWLISEYLKDNAWRNSFIINKINYDNK